MSEVMKNTELAKKLIEVATNYKTLYVMGCFGAPMTQSNKKRYCNNHSYNKKKDRQKMIMSASSNTFGFDCVNLIKGILWGWNGDKKKSYGGASYATNEVPDVNADTMITLCSDISKDFGNVEVGEAVWMKGHIGVYVGDGLVVECTPKWENKVQITSCNCTKTGYNRRNWTKHGKLPFVKYEREYANDTELPVVSDKEEFDIGDTVDFIGRKHYSSSSATAISKKCCAGKAKVTAKKLNSKHPYHLVATAGGGSTVYGWVNKEDIGVKLALEIIKSGDKVKLSNNAPVYGTSRQFSKWVYSCTLYVRSVNGTRAVVSTQKSGDVTGAVDIRFLTKV